MPKTVVAEANRRRRRPTKQGVVLSEAMIVQTALRMVREHGAAGLSARRLGLALGADASTVYRYFRGMDELILALGDELMRQALAEFRATGDWRADLTGLGLRIHGVYLAHPQAAVLTASRVSGRANELAGDEAILGALRGAGFPDVVAVRIYHVFIDQCLAFAALDAAALVLSAPALESDQRMWRATYAHLPTSTHPNLAATAPLLADRMNDSAYPAALRMVLDSAEAELESVTAGDAAGMSGTTGTTRTTGRADVKARQAGKSRSAASTA
jgi:AcrR family transcriptional regulator